MRRSTGCASPDVLRLARRPAADKSLPRGVRIRLGLLPAYVAIPIAVRKHWPGTDEGFAVLTRLTGVDCPPSGGL